MTVSDLVIQGFCEPEFEAVKQAFADGFTRFGERGAGLSLVVDDKPVLNLWAGHKDKQQEQQWTEDTIVNVFSVTKGITALCVLQLVEQGLVDLERPLADYWPAFGCHGKEAVRVVDVMSHMSGVTAIHPPVPQSALYDWQRMVDYLADETPWFPPGEQLAYTPFTYGWLLGELVRQVTGKSIGQYWQETVAEPLGLDFFIGVPDQRLPDVSEVSANTSNLPRYDSADIGLLMKSEPEGVVHKAFANPMSMLLGTNSQEWRQAEVPAANGHGNARALALLYGALAGDGTLSGQPLLSAQGLALCRAERSAGRDAVLQEELRFSCGYMLSQVRENARFGSAAGFGHPGAGGCLGFADPKHRLGFGYVTNTMGTSVLLDVRAVALVDAVYAALGAR